jgi:hypothetical protein
MAKEKELLKEILANTERIMSHLKINSTVAPKKKAVKKKIKPAKKATVPKS